MQGKNKNDILLLKTTKNTYTAMFEEIFISLYLECIQLLIKTVDWIVTKISLYYTLCTIYIFLLFDQEPFKKDFILKNQKSRQKSDIEKDFYKLLNNSNFGYDCINNVNNCMFGTIFDEIDELRYIKKHNNLIDPNFSLFVNAHLQ